MLTFESFDRSHLRSSHCSQEGGSFVCLYGDNHVCSSLPVEGISDADYEQHIYKHHVFIKNIYERLKGISSGISSFSDAMVDSDKWNVYSASQNLAAVLNNPNKIKQVKRYVFPGIQNVSLGVEHSIIYSQCYDNRKIFSRNYGAKSS